MWLLAPLGVYEIRSDRSAAGRSVLVEKARRWALKQRVQEVVQEGHPRVVLTNVLGNELVLYNGEHVMEKWAWSETVVSLATDVLQGLVVVPRRAEIAAGVVGC